MVSELLQLQVTGQRKLATAYSCQILKTMLQVALDHGDWSTVVHMMPSGDPLQREEFGGDEPELVAIHKYKTGIADLKRKAYTGGGLPWWQKDLKGGKGDSQENLGYSPQTGEVVDPKGQKGKGKKGKDPKGKGQDPAWKGDKVEENGGG